MDVEILGDCRGIIIENRQQPKKKKVRGLEVKVRDTEGEVPRRISPGDGWGRLYAD